MLTLPTDPGAAGFKLAHIYVHGVHRTPPVLRERNHTSLVPRLSTWRDGCLWWSRWSTVAVVAVMWSVCQAEAPLHPSLGPAEAALRSVWFCGLLGVLGVVLGVGTWLWKDYYLGRRRAEGLKMEIRSEVVAEQQNNTHITWTSRELFSLPGGGPGSRVLTDGGPSLSRVLTDGGPSLSRVLTDGLLLCVLHEFLSQPSLPHVEALLARLKSLRMSEQVETLGRVEGVSGPRLDHEEPVVLEDEQHTRVTLTKHWRSGQGDLASTRAEAEQSVSRALGQHRTGLQACQDHQRTTTLLLQELTWSHSHLSGCLKDFLSSEPVQENFLSLDQQISTFQAHLEGLERRSPEGQAVWSCSSSSSSYSYSSCDAAAIGPRLSEPTPTPSDSVSQFDESKKDLPSLDEDDRKTLCERSALQFSSAFGRLRRSGHRK
ncbi:hypothetical protein NHX12_008930 [Muraenolepis orangiensis]|uniref:Uncharacterized protein n=1 Tax=Muraenolepis orangiensis TaxID=630683 RepID=A0A9Q0I8I3_9TELE|nr:hypothetical protein NHX12_008930 [Muraenolepis orangiensis]